MVVADFPKTATHYRSIIQVIIEQPYSRSNSNSCYGSGGCAMQFISQVMLHNENVLGCKSYVLRPCFLFLCIWCI